LALTIELEIGSSKLKLKDKANKTKELVEKKIAYKSNCGYEVEIAFSLENKIDMQRQHIERNYPYGEPIGPPSLY